MTTDTDIAGIVADLIRPIIAIENRTAQEAFDIMADRVRGLWRTPAWRVADAESDALRLHREKIEWMNRALEAEAKAAHPPADDVAVERVARELARFEYNCSVPEWNATNINEHWPKFADRARAAIQALQEMVGHDAP